MRGAKDKSSEPKGVQDLKLLIEEVRKKRFQLVDQLRRLRSKLNYKQAEHAALSKLTAESRGPKANVGKLKRLKSSIEFRIATEASTLGAERELIKKLGDINQELDDALKSYRFRRKVELIAKDMEDIGKALESYKNQIGDEDKKLDELYGRLRSITGWKKGGDEKKPKPRKPEGPFEVSLEDIATIKNKKEE